MPDATDRPPRVLLAIGNPERERQLLTALHEGGCTLTGRCLDGPSLVQQALTGDSDIVLASSGLHRWTRDSLTALHQAGVPVVLLAAAGEARAFADLAHVLPAHEEGPVIVAALHEAIRRGAVSSEPGAGSPASSASSRRAPRGNSEVIALVSGKGAPGTTTVAIGLAAIAESGGRRVLLVDGDLRGGSVGPYLDLDPRRGLVGLGVGPVDRPERVLDELQDDPGFSVLAGVERPEAQERLTPERLAGAVGTLQDRFDLILIDAGETIGGVTSATGAALIRSAERVLLVTTADLHGLWNARACLRFITESLGVPPEAVSAIVNRSSSRGQFGMDEVERALGIRVLGAIPEDLRSAYRARSAQTPITATGGRAAAGIAELASHLAGLEGAEHEHGPGDLPGWRRWRRQPAEGRR